MALKSLGSDFSASLSQAWNSVKGFSFSPMPPSSTGQPISFMTYRSWLSE